MVELHESTVNSLNSPSHDQLSGDFAVLTSAHLTPLTSLFERFFNY